MTEPSYININDDPAALGTFIPGSKPDTSQPNTSLHGEQQGTQTFESDLTGGKDPAYITRMEMFEGIPHAEIYAKVRAMEPGLMQQQADTWISIANTLSGGLLGTHIAIQKALADGIEGQMADAAVGAAQKFYQQAYEAQQVIFTCGHRIKAVAHAAEVVKMSVPPPAAPIGERGTDTTLDPSQVIIAAVSEGIAGTGDGEQVAYQKGVEALYRTAIDTMNNSYKPSYQPAGDGVPVFVPVAAPGEGNPVDPGSGLTGPGTNNPNSSTTDGPAPSTEDTPETNPATVNPAGAEQDSDSGQQQAQTTPSGTTSTTPAGTTTAPGTQTTVPGQPGSPGTPTSGIPAPGTPSPGTPSPGSPGAPVGVPTPGRSVLGQPNAGNPASAVSSAAANRAAAAGRPGAPGMMPPGAGRNKDDESSHQTPDYLIGDHEEELLGRREATVPPVIGDDAAASQASAPQQPGGQGSRG